MSLTRANRASQVITLVIQHVGHGVDDVLLIPQETCAPMASPGSSSASRQAGLAQPSRRVGLEGVQNLVNGGLACDHDMDVISADVERMEAPGTVFANPGDGTRNGPALFFAEEHRLLGQ